MYIHTKLLFKKRDDYVEVCVYYSRLGLKFRESTGVKILPKHITKNGDISASHPYYELDLKRIGEVQDVVEALIADYIQQHYEKPSVEWLQVAYKSSKNKIPTVAPIPEKVVPPPPLPLPSIPSAVPPDLLLGSGASPAAASQAHPLPAARPVSDPPTASRFASAIPPSFFSPVQAGGFASDEEESNQEGDADVDENALLFPELGQRQRLELPVLFCWRSFSAGKKKVYRSQGAMARMNNARHSFRCYHAKRGVEIRFNNLGQLFFNDYVKFMAEEQEYYHNVKDADRNKVKPSIGLNNNTTIKRLTDLREYLKYCVVIQDIPLDLKKIDYYIDVAKKRTGVRKMAKDQRWELTLDVDEIEFVVNLDCYEPDYWASLTDNEKRSLDIIIFMCLQGTNPSDTKAVGKNSLQGDRMIGDRSKNFNQYDVELDPIAEAILVRNDFDLTFTPQTLGEQLKRLFVTIFELYRHHYEKRTGIPYQMICRQQHRKGNKTIVTYKQRGLFMEASTGRKTYATIMDEIKSRREVMKSMGHTVSSTTEGYIHKRQQFTQKQSVFGITKKAPGGAKMSA